MSLLYIVDGCNAAYRFSRDSKNDALDTRVTFLSHLHSCRPQGSFNNRLIVVFDGYPFKGDMFGCEVIFSQSRTADDKIKEMAAGLSRPKDAVVVTDDRELGFFVRSCGVRLMNVEEFMDKGKVKKSLSGRRRPDAADKSDLNIVQREKITEELRRLWLNKK